MNIDTILSRDQLKKLYPSFIYASHKILFEMADVPDNLIFLIPYAEIWGISDDLERETLIEKTPDALKANLKWVINQFEEEMDSWLAGEEALTRYPSNAYIAFSSLRMAADFI
ncbi:MAG: hypothetical protein LRY66_13380 [Saccharospirillaceae bacterium]|nr:hypothetical protein [Saccharospirillaceae bacterium]MCD8532302.1 hypothetical protein [Saccharospirillaceae bacterium]